MTKTEIIEVQVGSVWKDWDKRVRDLEPGRRVRVESVGDTHAEVVNLETGKTTKVKLDRFRPTSKGYKLIEPIAVKVDEVETFDARATPLPIPQRVAARRIRIARGECERLERVIARRRKLGKSVGVEKGERRLAEAQKRLAELTS